MHPGPPPQERHHLHINVVPNPSRSDHTQPYDSKGISWTRPSTRTPSVGLLGLPALSPIRQSPVEGEDRAKSWSVRRWKGLVSNSLRQMQREGWRGKVRLSRTGAAPLATRLSQGAVDLLSALWIVEPESSHATHSSKTGEHLKSPGGPGPRASGARPPQHLSRTGLVLLACLFLLGLREVFSRGSGPRDYQSIKIGSGRDPFAVLRDFRRPTTRTGALGLPGQERMWKHELGAVDTTVEEKEGDTTAIVLHWKRTDNMEVIVAHLCQYSFFKHVTVWNNNPDVFLTRDSFKKARCPASKLRIYNSPRNMLFVARYLACSHAETPNCFFQDDDWLVQPLRSLYSQFSRDPEGPVVVHTNPTVANLYGLEWCFYQQPLHTCFAWMGTGAFTARSHVLRFLSAVGEMGYPRDEVGHTDNSFATFLNNAPYVLSGPLSQLPQPFGHSDGAGIARNKAFIQKGLVHISKLLGIKYPADAAVPLPTAPLRIDTSAYREPQELPLAPHPYAHHTRSPCADDTCVFLTNIAQLPPPDAVPYPGPAQVRLEEWENHLGHSARGWMEGGELFNEEESWAARWPYSAAVDEDGKTAFRSPDVVQAGDYIGLGLLEPIEVSWIPRLSLHFVLEDSDTVLSSLVTEVSVDGLHWITLPDAQNVPTCQSYSASSTLPEPSLPSSYLASPGARAVLAEETLPRNVLARWWRRRRRRGRTLTECQLELSSSVGVSTSAIGEEGWRYVRLRSEKTLAVGWGVYELWIGPVGEGR